MSEQETRWYEPFLEDPEIAASQHALEKYKTPEDMLKSHFSLESYRGNSVKLLPDDATPEEKAAWVEKVKGKMPDVLLMPSKENEEDWNRFHHDLGVPKDPADYKPPADMEVLMDEESINQAVELSTKLGHTTKQHEQFVANLNEVTKGMQEAQQQFQADEEAKLKQHLGAAYEESMDKVNTIVKQFQDENVQLGDLNNAAKLFILNVAKSFESDPQVFNQINKPQLKPTPAELRDSVDNMREQLLDRSIQGKRRQDLLKKFRAASDELAQYG